MIEFEQVSVRYDGASRPTLSGIDLTIDEGELCLVVGRTGSGKSTFLKTINGLVPHFTGGTLHGRVRVGGRDTATHPPRELADLVGVVGQDPRAGFVTDIVEEELAYGMESIGLAPDVMRRRVEETLDLLGLVELRNRPLDQLSGGQRQRVAIGSVLTAHPSVLVLDEPTSALDPPAAEEVLAALQRLVHDLGITVVLAEHRLERVVQYADRVIHLPGDGAPIEVGAPAHIFATTPIAPPVVELGRLAGWSPLPLTIRDARRQVGRLRTQLEDRPPPAPPALRALDAGASVQARLRAAQVRFGGTVALRDIDLALPSGEILALMGRNGAGKSTLRPVLTGLVGLDSGEVLLGGTDPTSLRPSALIRRVGLVPQDPADLLYADTIAAECAASDRDSDQPAGRTAALLERLVPGLDPATHPRDLSEGPRLGLVLALVLSADPPLLLLDEPTRGLDYAAKRRLVAILRELADDGRAIVLATHDVELAAAVATRTIVIADGEIVVDGPTSDVVVGSPAFAPQIAKILAPLPFLTVEQVRAGLEAAS